MPVCGFFLKSINIQTSSPLSRLSGFYLLLSSYNCHVGCQISCHIGNPFPASCENNCVHSFPQSSLLQGKLRPSTDQIMTSLRLSANPGACFPGQWFIVAREVMQVIRPMRHRFTGKHHKRFLQCYKQKKWLFSWILCCLNMTLKTMEDILVEES